MSCPEVRRILLSAAALAAAAVVHGAEDTQFRYQASIAVDRPGAFVQLPLKADAYAHSLEPGLLDLRVVDANGARVPFAVLGPRGNQVETIDRARDATIYPLPPKPSADGTWTAPIELSVVGDRISVTRRGGPPPSRGLRLIPCAFSGILNLSLDLASRIPVGLAALYAENHHRPTPDRGSARHDRAGGRPASGHRRSHALPS